MSAKKHFLFAEKSQPSADRRTCRATTHACIQVRLGWVSGFLELGEGEESGVIAVL
jgi:hypothetical protein